MSETWSGQERRKGNQAMINQCNEIFKRLEDKLDGLIEYDKKINGQFEKHIDESYRYRTKIDIHEEQLKNINTLKRWWYGAIITIIGGIISIAVVWGGTLARLAHIEKTVFK